jgi:hypothetical protein
MPANKEQRFVLSALHAAKVEWQHRHRGCCPLSDHPSELS